jgi:D-aspartate ligase
MKPTAVVLNMFYTGLGAARSLGEHGVRVIGLSSQRRVYGNYTRYARIVLIPDSRNQPEELLKFLLDFGRKQGERCVIIPTRDDDLVFLDRYRQQLGPLFSMPMAATESLATCLDKWKSYCAAVEAGVPTPRCWIIRKEDDLDPIESELSWPCVMKPVSAFHWRNQANWDVVGRRKAVVVRSMAELRAEYSLLSRANPNVLLQKLVPGDDKCLAIAACYIRRDGSFGGGFNTQKLMQIPEGFGTGCIVEAVNRPELWDRTLRLLAAIGYTGVAEVEYKWNAETRDFELIEVNPRPWDQHRLGKVSGIDLIYSAYCDHAGLEPPPPQRAMVKDRRCKWVAEDALLFGALSMVRRRDPRLRQLPRMLGGRCMGAIWLLRDPIPFLGYLVFSALPELAGSVLGRFRRVSKVPPESEHTISSQRSKA